MKHDTETLLRPTPSVSPSREIPPHSLIAHTQGPADSHPNQVQAIAYVDDIAVRGMHYAQPMAGAEIHSEHSHYANGGASMSIQPLQHPGLPAELYAGPHEASRRTSFVNPTSDYNSPTTPIYPSWPNATSAPHHPSSIYTLPGPQPSVHHNFGQQGASLTQNQHYMQSSYDGLGRTQDQGPVPVYRPGSVTQGQVSDVPAPYPNYIPQDSRGMPGSDVKMEALTRHGTSVRIGGPWHPDGGGSA